jgi:PAS domain S-box-containing protein
VSPEFNEQIKILLLEDNASDADLIVLNLRRSDLSNSVTIATSAEEFIKELSSNAPDVILSDHQIPGFSSWQALKLSKETYPDVPFVLVTGEMTDEIAAKLIRNGADDYLLKGNLKRLPTTIRLALAKKRIENSYDVSKASLQTIFEHTDSAYILTDESFTIISMNQLAVAWAARVVGRPLVKGENVFGYSNPTSEGRLTELRKKLGAGQPVTYETHYAGPHDSAWYYVRFLPVKNKTGKIINYTIAVSDITEHKNFEIERMASEQKLRNAHERLLFHVENAPLGFIEWDSALRVKSWSKRAEQVFGWTEQELLAKKEDGLNLVYDEDLSWVSQVVGQLLDGSIQSNTMQYRNVTRTGKVIWCEWFNSVQKDKEGNVVTIMSLVQDISEQRSAQLQREFDRNNLEALINNTDDLMWSVDSDFRLITCNKSFDRKIGESTGLTVRKGDNVAGPAFAATQFGNYEVYYRRALNGEAFIEIDHTPSPESWRELSFYPIRRRGEVVGTACFSKDITGTVIAEKDVAAREKRFRALIENSHDAISLHDAASNLQYQSPSVSGILGYDPEELLDKPVIDLAHSQDRKIIIDLYDRCAAAPGQPLPFQLRLVHKDGRYVWLEGVLTNLSGETNVAAFVMNYRDITNRKKMEEDLSTTIRRFEQAQQIAHLGHWEADFATQRSTWSDEAFRIYGIQPGTVEPSEELFLSFVHPDDRERVQATMQMGVQTLKSFSFFHKIVRTNGEVRDLYSMAQFEFNKDNRPVGLYGISLDITELTEKERELKRANSELETFIYRANHDLKSPIASILGMVNVARDEIHDAKSLEYFTIIGEVAAKQNKMLENLTNVMAIRNRSLTITSFPLTVLIKEVVHAVRQFPSQEGVLIDIEADNPFEITSDRDLWREVLQQIIGNAILHNSHKNEEKWVGIIVRSSNAGFLEIEIADNGIGMSETVTDNVFHMFFRGNSTSMGTGLGLYLVKNALKSLRATLSVTSSAGHGSAFRIMAPVFHSF